MTYKPSVYSIKALVYGIWLLNHGNFMRQIGYGPGLLNLLCGCIVTAYVKAPTYCSQKVRNRSSTPVT